MKRADLVIHDPKVSDKQIENDLKIKKFQNNHEQNIFLQNNSGKWRFSKSSDIFENAHAVLVLTEWEEYKN